jgi:ABC-type phosphate transport system substrate-binding protein
MLPGKVEDGTTRLSNDRNADGAVRKNRRYEEGRNAMRRIAAVAVVSLGLLLSAHPVARGAPSGFKVIVSASNTVTSLPASEVSQFFLKRATKWRAGAAVAPVDLPVASPVRDEFSRAVHGRPASAIDGFWTKQIFSGSGVPPLIAGSEREVVAFVRQNAGAIGYVSAEASVGEGVKVLDVVGR